MMVEQDKSNVVYKVGFYDGFVGNPIEIEKMDSQNYHNGYEDGSKTAKHVLEYVQRPKIDKPLNSKSLIDQSDHPACAHDNDGPCGKCHPDCTNENARCGCGDF
jgi:hypothetical protein